MVAPLERGDVVDVSGHAGETFTVTTDAEFPIEGGGGAHDGDGDHHDDAGHGDESDYDDDGGGHGGGGNVVGPLEELVQIRVTDPGGTTDDSADPRELDLPNRPGPSENAAVEKRHMTMRMDTKVGAEEPPSTR